MISKQARGRAWYSEHIVGANLIVKLTRFPLIAVTAAAAAVGRVLSLSLSLVLAPTAIWALPLK